MQQPTKSQHKQWEGRWREDVTREEHVGRCSHFVLGFELKRIEGKYKSNMNLVMALDGSQPDNHKHQPTKNLALDEGAMRGSLASVECKVERDSIVWGQSIWARG
jgi:hypothetical protein